jgi:3-deoxy-D-manno-octulosonate 8-phosphate phosphatase KdsC-like HAD superfamily phosphatase
MPMVQNQVAYVTEKPGGKGAVREICDLILYAKSLPRASL